MEGAPASSAATCEAASAAKGSMMPPSSSRQPAIHAPSASRTLPRAFTATTATATSSPSRSPYMPSPDFIACSPPRILPTVAPHPAPTFPSASDWQSRSSAAFAAARPMAASGWAFSPTSKSNRQALTTMGTSALSTGKPMPRSASSSMTPVDDAKPNALPPESTTACTDSIMFSGLSKSVSRVAGPPPRTSTPQTAPAGATSTVQPVPIRGSSAWAVRKAGRSAIEAVCNMGSSSGSGDFAIVHRRSPRRANRCRLAGE